MVISLMVFRLSGLRIPSIHDEASGHLPLLVRVRTRSRTSSPAGSVSERRERGKGPEEIAITMSLNFYIWRERFTRKFLDFF